ncbi:hypothetical protein V5E43_000693 [Yersinia enterocolitica]|uniref:hypothetical protein n=1 Tax=Yersinia TaxID=629 RepID=UPI0005E96D55|nr:MULTISPECIES: hypothetical protein [Yersinia]MCW6576428.1 hypothetical protein [Yersinia ruckeri]CQH79113.1 Peptidase U49 [Yersinia enterocolitica]
MTDIEIYAIAVHVLGSITTDLNEGIYSELGGEVKLSWGTTNEINAWAESTSSPINPPKHEITLQYKLVSQIYRDIEEYMLYMKSDCDKNAFDYWFKGINYHSKMINVFSENECIRNIFIAAITWIYFHELGHLMQEHGYIRSLYDNEISLSINECEVVGQKIPEGKTANIFHVTEIAADFFATNMCLSELTRHFKATELDAAIQFLSCGLSCVIYRFHGCKSFKQEVIPTGSHPNPLIRLEVVIPIIHEVMDIKGIRCFTQIQIDRGELVNIGCWSSMTVGMFWIRSNPEVDNIPDDFFIAGSLNRPGMKEYLKIIIRTWDEIEPEIIKFQRFDDVFRRLKFSDQLRNNVF